MKPAFKLPDRKVDDWVSRAGEGGQERPHDTTPTPPKVKPSRLTVDIDPGLHARFKAACALNATDMVTELRQFIESWTAEHSR